MSSDSDRSLWQLFGVLAAGKILGTLGLLVVASGAIVFFAVKAEWLSREPERYENLSKLAMLAGCALCFIAGLLFLIRAVDIAG